MIKKIIMTGKDVKQDNGSGYSLNQRFPKRRFHGDVLYDVFYHGVSCDCSTITKILRNAKQEF